MLRVEDVFLERGHQPVLVDLNAAFSAGRVTVVIGENGAGKSSLLDVLAGLLVPTGGRALLDAQSVSALPPRARSQRLASLSQRTVDAPALSALSRIAQGLAPRRGPAALLDDEARRRATLAAEQVGVVALLDRPLGALSGGERRRVEVARALVDEAASVFVFDEPFAGVDVRHQPLLADALRGRAAAGATVVVSVHQLDLALRLGDDVLALKGGRVVAHGPIEAAFTEAVLEEVFGVRARIERRPNGASVLF